jgi:hypothetical protein
MDRIISVLLSVFLVAGITIYSGCGGGAATDNLGNIPITPTPTPTPGPTPSPNPSAGTISSFYVGVSSTVYDVSHVHASTGFSTTCSIESSVSSSQDLVCYVEMPEADVALRDLTLQLHVPPDMCRYMVKGTYWFYNEEVGVGPTSINIHTYKTINEDASGTTTTFKTNYDCTVNGALDTDCDNQSEIITHVSDTDGSASLKCVYDRSDEGKKHNCCFGEYTYTETLSTDNVVFGASTTTTVTSLPVTIQWGGVAKDCIGGAGRTDWESYDSRGFPAYQFQVVDSGLDEEYKITNANDALELSADPHTLHTANFYSTSGGVDHTHSGYVLATSSSKPYFVAPIDDRSGTPIDEANDSYVFYCMDSAFETKHRISVFVREWDTRADYDTYISTSGVTAVPDRGSQSSPVSCIGLVGPCDDFHDSDDFLNLDLGVASYDTTTVGTRNQNFPYLIYK